MDKKYPLEDFRHTNCKLWASSSIGFFLVYMHTNGDPCTTGCAWYDGGKCPDYVEVRKRNRRRTELSIQPETNAELAKKLGVSKRQVAKMRKAGTLPPAGDFKYVITGGYYGGCIK